MLFLCFTSFHLHKKNSEVSIKTRSTPASLSIQGQVTKHTTVKWPIRTYISRKFIINAQILELFSFPLLFLENIIDLLLMFLVGLFLE